MADYLAWTRSPDRYFGSPEPGFETLRKPWPADAPPDLVETSYFGFSIPDEDIHCEVYHWAHPMLGITSGGIMIFRGKKPTQAHADYIDYRNYQPLPDDITNCVYADGVEVRMIEPAKTFEIRFDDPANQTSVRFTSTAIMPPAFRPNGGHFTQACRSTGTLVLHGQRYEIDSYFTRDRSWGHPRGEGRMDIPPAGWHVGVFGDDLAFHVIGFENPEWVPALATRYPGMGNGKNFIWGYIWKNGRLLGVKSCAKRMSREDDGIAPAGMHLTIVDENDEVYQIEGTITARLPMCLWPNMTFFFALTRWTLQGDSRFGWGDTQEVLYPTYIRENAQGPAPVAFSAGAQE